MTRSKQPDGAGTLYKKDTPAGTRWKAVFDVRDADGRKRQITGTGKTAGEALQRRQASYDKWKGYGAAGVAGKPYTAGQWLLEWHRGIDSDRVKDNVRRNYLTRIEKYLIPFIGERPLKELTREDIRVLFSETLPNLAYDPKNGEARLAATSRHNIFRVLSIALGEAVKQGKIDNNPAEGIQAPKRSKGRRSVSEETRSIPETVMFFQDGKPDEFRYALACVFGMRQSERLGLRWQDLYHALPKGFEKFALNNYSAEDWETFKAEYDGQRKKPTMHINGVLDRKAVNHGCGSRSGNGGYPCGEKTAGTCPKRTGGGGWYWRAEPKNNSSQRIIPLPLDLLPAIRRHKAQQEQWKKSTNWKPLPGASMNDLVFTTETGRPIVPNIDNKQWRELLEQLGQPYIDGHTLRHICITEMALKGYNPSIIQALAGHTKGSKITAEIYTHIEAAFIPMDKIYGDMLEKVRIDPFNEIEFSIPGDLMESVESCDGED